MQTNKKFFDDLARVGGGMFSTFIALREEIQGLVRQQCDHVLRQFDLVRREEFDAVREIAVKARTEQEALMERVTSLEQALMAQKPKKTKAVQAHPKKDHL